MGVGLCTYDATKKIGMETTMTQASSVLTGLEWGNLLVNCSLFPSRTLQKQLLTEHMWDQI